MQFLSCYLPTVNVLKIVPCKKATKGKMQSKEILTITFNLKAFNFKQT